jgi:hypothetical protein
VTVRRWLAGRPWVWVLALIAFFVVADLIMVLIAISDPPQRV